MDSRVPRIRRKLAHIPYLPRRSHSFGEDRDRFLLGPRLSPSDITSYEAEQGVELPSGYRDFLLGVGGSGASPFYGLLPLDRCSLFTMNPPEQGSAGRGFSLARRFDRPGDLFLNIIEAGCTDLVLLAVTGPLTGRVLTGNGDGFWGPNVSSAADFLAWYERWLDHMADERDNRSLELTSPGLVRPRH